jgi:hypothetical protein
MSSFVPPIVTPTTVVTHLGNIIKPGDLCAGYDLTCAQFNDEALESYQGLQLPEVILVKKGKPGRLQPSLRMSRVFLLTFAPRHSSVQKTRWPSHV